MAEEMRAHLDVLTEEYVAAGMSETEARLAAQKRFGGIAQIEERCRDEQRFVWLEQIGKEVRQAVRSLFRTPGFSLTTLLTLVLGIGVATIAFKMSAELLIFSPRFPHPQQLFLIGFTDRQGQQNPYRYPFHHILIQ